MAFERLGTGYESWSIMAGVALENPSDIDTVIENAPTDNLDEFKKFTKK